MLRPALLLIALLAAFPAAAEIYSWRDKEGRLHYSDVPPPDGEVKTLRNSRSTSSPSTPEPAAGETTGSAAGQAPANVPPGTAGTSNAPKTMADRELEFRKRRTAQAEAEAKAEKERADAAQRQRACEQARSQLAALESGQRIARFTNTGERAFLDDSSRMNEINEARTQVEQLCR